MGAVDVTFMKLGARRYGVAVSREKAPDLIMASAPGYDPFLPHDLVHLVAECEWGLRHGIFGQLDELAERWHTLQVGASITLPWPWPEGPCHTASRRSRKRARPAVRRRARS
ncbi:MAG TPA: hypothetical protein VMN35_07250 [Gaiellaceae bacterium]|nr:hypothetical protein [Gaiellaceae bacterium]